MKRKSMRPLTRLHGYWLYRNWLPRMAELDAAARKEWIIDRLRKVLQSADAGVPFYHEAFRKAGFDPAKHLRSPDDIEALPLLRKKDIRDAGERLHDKNHSSTALTAHTSGTTGEPTAMLLNARYVAVDYACMFRHWAKAGYDFRDPFAALRSYVPDKPGGPISKYNWWQNTLYLSAYDLRPANAAEYLEKLLEFRPKFLRGYPSALHVLAKHAVPHRAQFQFLRGIFPASETLTEEERNTIRQTFHGEVLDWYGMTEPAVVITERADHQGMEVNWEYGFPEFLEDPDLPANQRRLVTTSLHNPAMPFIRFDTGDVVEIEDQPDATGLYPLVRRVIGRKDDCLLTPDGGRLPSLNFYSLLQEYQDILRFQFVQNGTGKVTINLLLRPEKNDPTTLLNQLDVEFARRLGDLPFIIDPSGNFRRSPDGKTPVIQRG